MDTSNFDSQDRQHLSFYHGFMTFTKLSVIAVILTLVLMAIFLL